MAHERAPLARRPAVERRTQAAAVQLKVAPTASHRPASALPASVQAARPATRVASVAVSLPASVQCARVSQPGDPAELEAVRTARKVMQMGEPPTRVAAREEDERKPVVQRAAGMPKAVKSVTAAWSGGCDRRKTDGCFDG